MRLSPETVQEMFNFIKKLPWEVSADMMEKIRLDVEKNKEEDEKKKKPLAKAK